MRWTRARLLLAGVVLAGVVLATGLPLASATPAAARDFTPAPIVWGGCEVYLAQQGLQCGRVRVPLDPAVPQGATIELAVSRLQHTGTTYHGVMLTNPGGPGLSGLDMPTLATRVPGTVARDYDWIGFDPRGVGDSSPRLTCQPGYTHARRMPYVPASKKAERAWLTRVSSYAAACARGPGAALLPHLASTDTVADMEVLRQALGVDRISFYGRSYGTYLGQLYATLHPDRVDKMVLDSVSDASRAWYGTNLDQEAGFDRNFDAFLTWVAGRDGRYHLGSSPRALRQRYYATLRRLVRHPAGRLGPDEVTDVMLDGAYYVYGWNTYAQELAALLRRGDGRPLLADWRRAHSGDDNTTAVYDATTCTDAPWPGQATVLRDARRTQRRHPFATWALTWGNAPCVFWKAPARARPAVSGAGLAGPILMFDETRDASTPYRGDLYARSRFPTASLVAGAGGTTHTATLSGVACVDDTIARYLATGQVPARVPGAGADLTCPRVPADVSLDY